jgi:hypothetical protein
MEERPSVEALERISQLKHWIASRRVAELEEMEMLLEAHRLLQKTEADLAQINKVGSILHPTPQVLIPAATTDLVWHPKTQTLKPFSRWAIAAEWRIMLDTSQGEARASLLVGLNGIQCLEFGV